MFKETKTASSALVWDCGKFGSGDIIFENVTFGSIIKQKINKIILKCKFKVQNENYFNSGLPTYIPRARSGPQRLPSFGAKRDTWGGFGQLFKTCYCICF